jgi:hypothetical protein
MGSRYTKIKEEDIEFIRKQPLFFVATAAKEGSINLSPKGHDTLRVISSNKVIWLNLTGSGNETSAHLQDDGRITFMFCAFDGKPLILRLYGQGRVVHPYDDDWHRLLALFDDFPNARQVIECKISMVQRSCGFGVPFMEYKGTRPDMASWVENKGEKGIRRYWKEKNQSSIDGLPTNIIKTGFRSS